MLTPLVSSLTNPIPALQPAAWFRGGYGVTGTLTASNWADQSGNGRDLAQGTAGNQPIYLPYSGTPYAYLPGVASNSFSTPDAAANSPVDEIKIDFIGALDDWTPANSMGLISKYQTGSAADSYGLALKNGSSGTVSLIHVNGTTTTIVDSTAANGFTDGTTGGVRVTWDKTTGDTKFYKSTDLGETWTQLGTTVAGPTTALNNGTRSLFIGVQSDGTTQPMAGKCYRAKVYTTIAATSPSVDFNPSTFTETSTNGATAVASTGETWTLNSTGSKPAQIVKSASLLFDGVDDYMKTAAFALNQPETIYLVGKQVSWTVNDQIFDGNAGNDMRLLQYNVTPQIGQYANSGGAIANANADSVIGSNQIITSIFNGTSSLIQVNNGTATTGVSPGADNGSGFTLGAYGTGLSGYGNIQVKEVLIFSAAHTAAERDRVRNWLNYVHHCY